MALIEPVKLKLPVLSFFFPSHKIGGVEVMFTRIAKILLDKGYVVEVCDYEGGSMHRIMGDAGGKYIKTIFEKNQQLKSESEICITSLLYLPYAKNIFPENLKLLFWDDHPYNLILYLGYLKIIKLFNLDLFLFFTGLFNRRKFIHLKDSLSLAIKYNSVVFMCDINYELNRKSFNLNSEPNYLPIPVSGKQIRTVKPIGEVINCSYLGRLDRDKFGLCKELMSDIIAHNQSNTKKKVKLHIIGEGDHSYLIKEIVQKYSDYFIFCGIIKGKELDDYFIREIDCSFAVGTSALESAGLGIPTVFMRSLTLSKKFSNKYLWVNNNTGFNLSITKSVDLRHLIGFDSLINELKEDSVTISGKCFEYVHDNHSINTIIEKLLNYSGSTMFSAKLLINYK